MARKALAVAGPGGMSGDGLSLLSLIRPLNKLAITSLYLF